MYHDRRARTASRVLPREGARARNRSWTAPGSSGQQVRRDPRASWALQARGAGVQPARRDDTGTIAGLPKGTS